MNSPTRFSPFFSTLEPAWATDHWVKIFRRVIRNFLEIILRRINLPAVSYCTESCDLSGSYLKRQYNNIFDLFFLILAYHDHWVIGKNIFDFCWDFNEFFEFFVKNLLAVWYYTESVSLQYDTGTAGSHSWPQPFLKTFTQSYQGTLSQK